MGMCKYEEIGKLYDSGWNRVQLQEKYGGTINSIARCISKWHSLKKYGIYNNPFMLQLREDLIDNGTRESLVGKCCGIAEKYNCQTYSDIEEFLNYFIVSANRPIIKFDKYYKFKKKYVDEYHILKTMINSEGREIVTNIGMGIGIYKALKSVVKYNKSKSKK